MFTNAGLIESMRQYRLLDAPQLEEAKPLATSLADPRALANELTRRGWLTAFQVRMLAQGRGPQLVIGPYVILEKLGEGGMGAVFKARNTRLGRLVAIKLLRKERNTNAELIQRFHREVQVASSLSHPNVVRAFDAVEVDGSLIFEMEYIEGVNLTQLVHKRGALPVPMACDFIRQTALGLQHAHEKGLVHRDIKPSNLVVSRALTPSVGSEPSPHGLVKLLDMGLALIATPEGQPEKTRLTQLGKVVGTTDFLSPEQARNSHGVDIRADLYSLGCTFYFLLTGRVPFPDGPPMEKLLKHQLDEPDAVDQLRPEVPPALVAIVQKLMAKKPENRYQTPAEVAAVLEPFARPSSKSTAVPPVLTTLPAPLAIRAAVAAKPPSGPTIPALPSVKPASAPMLPAAVASAVAVLEPPPLPVPSTATATATLTSPPPLALATTPLPAPAAPALAVQADPGSDPFLQMASSAPKQPVVGKRGLLLGLVVLTVVSGLSVGVYFAFFRGKTSSSVEKKPDPKPWNLDQLDSARIPAAERISSQPKELVAVVGEHRQRHWSAVSCVACSPDGKYIVSGGYDGFIRIWAAKTGNMECSLGEQTGRVFTVAFLPDNVLLSVNQAGSVVLAMWWNLEMKSNIRTVELGKSGRNVLAAAVSPVGDVLALAGSKRDGTGVVGEASVVTLGTDSIEEHPLPADKNSVNQLAWSPDGKILAGASGKSIKLWDVGAATEIATLPGHDYPVAGLTFIKDGKVLASCCSYAKAATPLGEIKLWDLPAAKKPTATISVPGNILGMTYDPKREALAWGSIKGPREFGVTVWNLAEKKEQAYLGPLDSRPTAVAFAADGRELVSAGEDQAIRLWNLADGKERSVVSAFRGRIVSPVLSPDGQLLAYLVNLTNPEGTVETSVLVWNFAAGKETTLGSFKEGGARLGFLADGKTLVYWGASGATFWEAATGKKLTAFKPPADFDLIGPIASDGHSVVVGGKGAGIKLWDPLTGSERVLLKDNVKGANAIVAYSPDGKLVAAAGPAQPVVHLHETKDGQARAILRGLSGPVVALAFSTDGRQVASVARDGGVRIWDTTVALPAKDPIRAQAVAGSSALAFSTNGAYLAVWGPRSLAVVEAATGKGRTVMEGPDVIASAISFAPTGQTLAFINSAGRLFLIDPAKLEAADPRSIVLPGPAHALTFAADGRHLVTANGNGTLYVLRLEAAGK